jgi:hypothetical protein
MNEEQERPPVFGSWRRLYWAVGLYLVAVIVLFSVFTRVFNR